MSVISSTEHCPAERSIKSVYLRLRLTFTLLHCYRSATRGTPRVQFANIRKMVLCQGLPHLCVDPCMTRHAKVSTQVYVLDRKIWKRFRPCGKGWKRAKCDQFFCPTSDFFDFCNPCFFYHTFMMWILLTKSIYMQKLVTTVCLHCSFARLKNKHRSTGNQGLFPGGTGGSPHRRKFCQSPPHPTLVPIFGPRLVPPAEVRPRKFEKFNYIFVSNLTTFKLKSTLKELGPFFFHFFQSYCDFGTRRIVIFFWSSFWNFTP